MKGKPILKSVFTTQSPPKPNTPVIVNHKIYFVESLKDSGFFGRTYNIDGNEIPQWVDAEAFMLKQLFIEYEISPNSEKVYAILHPRYWNDLLRPCQFPEEVEIGIGSYKNENYCILTNTSESRVVLIENLQANLATSKYQIGNNRTEETQVYKNQIVIMEALTALLMDKNYLPIK